MTPDIFMGIIAFGVLIPLVLFVNVSILMPQSRRAKVQKLSRAEFKIEKKRLGKLLITDHDKAIVELHLPQYDSILQELAKSHKRDTQLIAISKIDIKDRIKPALNLLAKPSPRHPKRPPPPPPPPRPPPRRR